MREIDLSHPQFSLAIHTVRTSCFRADTAFIDKPRDASVPPSLPKHPLTTVRRYWDTHVKTALWQSDQEMAAWIVTSQRVPKPLKLIKIRSVGGRLITTSPFERQARPFTESRSLLLPCNVISKARSSSLAKDDEIYGGLHGHVHAKRMWDTPP
jgi:hypothetical protein